MIRRIKERLKIEGNEKDLEIESFIYQVELYIKNYCNIEKIPIELNGFIENKVIESFINERDLSIKSISIDDTNIVYTDDSFFRKQELMILRRYRRTR